MKIKSAWMANEFSRLVCRRTGLKTRQLVCPREKSEMTPCIARDGVLAVADGARDVCVGCERSVEQLYTEEAAKHA